MCATRWKSMDMELPDALSSAFFAVDFCRSLVEKPRERRQRRGPFLLCVVLRHFINFNTIKWPFKCAICMHDDRIWSPVVHDGGSSHMHMIHFFFTLFVFIYNKQLGRESIYRRAQNTQKLISTCVQMVCLCYIPFFVSFRFEHIRKCFIIVFLLFIYLNVLHTLYDRLAHTCSISLAICFKLFFDWKTK